MINNILIGVFSFYIVMSIFIFKYLMKKIDKLNENNLKHQDEILLARKDSVKKSKEVTRGHISEEFIPLFPDFPYDMSECKFSGMPVDYLVYKGMNNVRDGITDSKIEIIFADVKVNTSQRNKVQNAIKKAIEESRFRWETWIIDENKKIIIK